MTTGAVDRSTGSAEDVAGPSRRRPPARPASARPASARSVVVRPVNPTRQRILDTALLLFNERGTAHVTTNHIAAEAGLSPGNLYYWFRNKQQVVRALVLDWVAEVDRRVAEVTEQPAHVHALWEDLTRTASLEDRYRFVRRELLALLHDDAELAAGYRSAYGRWVDARAEYVRRLVRAGVLEPPAPPRTPEDLAVALWLVTEYWPVHDALRSGSGVGRHGSGGVRPLLVLLGPHLTPQGVRALESL